MNVELRFQKWLEAEWRAGRTPNIQEVRVAFMAGADESKSGGSVVEGLREHIAQMIEDLADEYKDSPNALGALGRVMKYVRTVEIEGNPPHKPGGDFERRVGEEIERMEQSNAEFRKTHSERTD